MQRMVALVATGTLFMSAVCLEAVEYSVGCKSGLGMAMLYGKNANRYSKEIIKGLTDIEAEAKEAMRVGFSGGLVFSAAFNDYAALQLECLYSMFRFHSAIFLQSEKKVKWKMTSVESVG